MSDKEDALSELNTIKTTLERELILVENNWSSDAKRFSIYIIPNDMIADINRSIDWAIKHVTNIQESEDEPISTITA